MNSYDSRDLKKDETMKTIIKNLSFFFKYEF